MTSAGVEAEKNIRNAMRHLMKRSFSLRDRDILFHRTILLRRRNRLKESGSGKINIAVLDYVAERIKPGVSTKRSISGYMKDDADGSHTGSIELLRISKECLHFIDEVVCHGIPDKNRILQEGEIINIDVSTIYKGYYSDSSRMFCIGEVRKKSEN